MNRILINHFTFDDIHQNITHEKSIIIFYPFSNADYTRL